jgi:archaellum component FlaC
MNWIVYLVGITAAMTIIISLPRMVGMLEQINDNLVSMRSDIEELSKRISGIDGDLSEVRRALAPRTYF